MACVVNDMYASMAASTLDCSPLKFLFVLGSELCLHATGSHVSIKLLCHIWPELSQHAVLLLCTGIDVHPDLIHPTVQPDV